MNKSVFGHSRFNIRDFTIVLFSSHNIEFVEHIVKRSLNGWFDVVQNEFFSISYSFDD